MGVKKPDRPEDIFEPLTADLKEALGVDVLGASLYGAAAAGAYQKGQSSLRLIILLADGASRPAVRLIPFYKKWQKAGLAVPVLVTPHYIETSRDAFPIEFMVMAAFHKPVFGVDSLEGIQVKPEDLRLQLERELKGKLTTLRTRLLACLGAKAGLMALADEALPAFTALFQAYLKLTAGQFPQAPADVMDAMAGQGCKVLSFAKLAQVHGGALKPGAPELLSMVEGAIAELSDLCDQVDKMEVSKEAAQ